MEMNTCYSLQSLPFKGLPREKPARGRHYADDTQQPGSSSRAVPTGAGDVWRQWAGVLELGSGAYSVSQRKGAQKIYIYIFIHSLVFSLRGRVGRNQSPVM